MSNFLDEMARHSHERAASAAGQLPLAQMRARALTSERPVPLSRELHGASDGTFNLIAEVKLRSPAAGALADDGAAGVLAERARMYARGGACAVSVLTEPSRFDGSLQHLTHASAALRGLNVPAMRKDFLVAPYQVYEARAAGASGVLLIAALLNDATLAEMLAAAREMQLFVLLEAFDALELARAGEVLARADHGVVLVGLNCRDLRTLAVDSARFAELSTAFPGGYPSVAESGVHKADSAAQVAALGYHCALVGTALMRASDPTCVVQKMLQAGRVAASRRASQ